MISNLIVKQYSNVDVGKCIPNTSIIYLDVNPLMDVQWIEWFHVNWLKAREISVYGLILTNEWCHWIHLISMVFHWMWCWCIYWISRLFLRFTFFSDQNVGYLIEIWNMEKRMIWYYGWKRWIKRNWFVTSLWRRYIRFMIHCSISDSTRILSWIYSSNSNKFYSYLDVWIYWMINEINRK